MKKLIPFLLWVFCGMIAWAAPVMVVEVDGVARPLGGTIRLVESGLTQVSDPLDFVFEDEPGLLTVSFPNIVPGDYRGQVSFDGEVWEELPGLLVHSVAGTLSFTHDPGAVVMVSYRLVRVLESCAVVTIRNTGDEVLTGIAPVLFGANFTLDTSSMVASLNPGETTTVTVCFTATDLNEHFSSVQFGGDANVRMLHFFGDNDPGSFVNVLPAPTITVFTSRTAFESSVGESRVTDGFSNAVPLLPVASRAKGSIGSGTWNDIIREPDPSTIWSIVEGTTGWGGTWDLTVAGTGGGLAFDLDFGGGKIVTVPGHLPAGSAANLFFGFTANQPFYSVRVRQFDSAGNTLQETHSFDDMTFQVSPTGAGGGIVLHDGPSTASPQLTDGQTTAVDFGTVARNSVASRLFTVVNSGPDPLKIYDISGGGIFQITNLPPLPLVLASGEDFQFEVALFTGAGGLFAQQISVLSNSVSGLRFDFPMNANLPFVREIALINTQNEEAVVDGQSKVIEIAANPFGGSDLVSIRVENSGLDPLHVTGVMVPAGFQFFTGGGLPLTVPAGESRSLSFSLIGPASGLYQGSVTVLSDDLDEGSITFPIRGPFNTPEIEVGTGFFGSTPLTQGGVFDVGTTMLGETRRIPLRVSNLHAGPLVVTGVTLPAGYSLSSPVPTFPFTLGRNQGMDLNFDVNSTTAGTFSGTLLIANNDYDEGPFNLEITGTVLDESILFFGFSTFIDEGGSVNATGIGSGEVSYEWDLDDDGDFDDATGATVDLPDTDGPDAFLAKVRMTDSLTTMIRTATIPVNNVAPVVSFPTVGPAIAGQLLSFNVAASDVPADEAAGVTWRIDWGDGVVETTAAGEAVSTVFSHTYSQLGRAEILIEATDKDGDTGQMFLETWVFSAVIGVFDGPDVSGEELRDGGSSLSFLSFVGGTEDRALTILNRSAAPTSVGPFQVPTGYEFVSPPVFPLTLAASESVTLTLRFAPTVGGNYDGELSFVTGDAATPSFEIALSGFADAPRLRVSEFQNERFDFESESQSFEIPLGVAEFSGRSFNIASDNFSAPLTITSIELPAGFQFGNPPVFPLQLSEPSEINLRIQCHATVAGVYKGWVTIISNDSQRSPFRFFVRSRVGSAPDLRVSSATTDLESAVGLISDGAGGSRGMPLQLNLNNQGDLDLIVSGVTLPVGYEFVSAPVFPITMGIFGSSILPEIQLTATEPGTYSGAVVILSNDPDEGSFSFTLSETIPGGEVPVLSTSGVVIRASEPGVAAGVSGMIVGGQANGAAFVEASVDLGQTDPWRVIETVLLDANGKGSFGNPSPIEDPQSLGSAQWFFRIRQ